MVLVAVPIIPLPNVKLFLYHNISDCLDLKYVIFYSVNITTHSLDPSCLLSRMHFKKSCSRMYAAFCMLLYFIFVVPLVMAANKVTLCLINMDLLVKYVTANCYLPFVSITECFRS